MSDGKKWGLSAAFIGILALVVTSQGIGQSKPATSGAPSNVGAAAGRRVAVLDVVRIFNECNQIKDLNEKMKQAGDEYAAEVRRRREKLDALQTELRAFRPGTADYETRRKEFVKLTIDANAWAKATEEDIERQKYDWTRIIYGRTIEVSGQIAKDMGFDVVLQTSEFKPLEMPEQDVQSLRRFIQQRAVIYNVADIDITDAVINRLNQEYRASSTRTTTQPAGNAP